MTVQAGAFLFFPTLLPGYNFCNPPRYGFIHQIFIFIYLLKSLNFFTDLWKRFLLRIIFLVSIFINHQVDFCTYDRAERPTNSLSHVMIVALIHTLSGHITAYMTSSTRRSR